MYVRLEESKHGHTVTGTRFTRGSNPYGTGGQMVGYMLSCDCGWGQKVNEPKREATRIARHHPDAHKQPLEVGDWPRWRCRSCGADFDETDAGVPRCPDCSSTELVDHTA